MPKVDNKLKNIQLQNKNLIRYIVHKTTEVFADRRKDLTF